MPLSQTLKANIENNKTEYTVLDLSIEKLTMADGYNLLQLLDKNSHITSIIWGEHTPFSEELRKKIEIRIQKNVKPDLSISRSKSLIQGNNNSLSLVRNTIQHFNSIATKLDEERKLLLVQGKNLAGQLNEKTALLEQRTKHLEKLKTLFEQGKTTTALTTEMQETKKQIKQLESDINELNKLILERNINYKKTLDALKISQIENKDKQPPATKKLIKTISTENEKAKLEIQAIAQTTKIPSVVATQLIKLSEPDTKPATIALNQAEAAHLESVISIVASFPTKIQKLDFSGSKPTTETIEQLAELLVIEQLALEELDISKMGLSDEDISTLIKALQENPLLPLKKLNLQRNIIGLSAATFLADFLTANITLKYLDISYTELSEPAFQQLAVGIQENGSLEVLDLHGNKFSEAMAVIYAQALLQNKSLQFKRLALSYCKLNDQAAKALQPLLAQPNRLDSFFFEGNLFTDDGARFICEGLRSRANPFFLFLRSNLLTKAACHSLGELTALNKITTISLANNKLTDAGCLALVNGFNHNTSLQMIDLRGVGLTSETAAQFIPAIVRNKKLWKLDLSDNPLGVIGIKQLSETFISAGYLPEELFLNNTAIQDTGIRYLVDLLVKLDCIGDYLSLCDNQLTDKAIPELMRGLPHAKMSNLFLRLLSNQFTVQGIKQLLKDPVTCNFFSHLGLEYNPLEPERAAELVPVIQSNPALWQKITWPSEFKDALEKLLNISKDYQLIIEGTCLNLQGKQITANYLLSTIKTLDEKISSQLQEVLEIKLADNKLGANAGKAIGKLIQLCPKLQKLDISNTNLTDSNARALAKYLQKAKHLHALNISGNKQLNLISIQQLTGIIADKNKINNTTIIKDELQSESKPITEQNKLLPSNQSDISIKKEQVIRGRPRSKNPARHRASSKKEASPLQTPSELKLTSYENKSELSNQSNISIKKEQVIPSRAEKLISLAQSKKGTSLLQAPQLLFSHPNIKNAAMTEDNNFKQWLMETQIHGQFEFEISTKALKIRFIPVKEDIGINKNILKALYQQLEQLPKIQSVKIEDYDLQEDSVCLVITTKTTLEAKNLLEILQENYDFYVPRKDHVKKLIIT